MPVPSPSRPAEPWQLMTSAFSLPPAAFATDATLIMIQRGSSLRVTNRVFHIL